MTIHSILQEIDCLTFRLADRMSNREAIGRGVTDSTPFNSRHASTIVEVMESKIKSSHKKQVMVFLLENGLKYNTIFRCCLISAC